MKKEKSFWIISVFCVLGVALICTIAILVNKKFELKEQALMLKEREYIIDSENTEVAGFFKTQRPSEEGIYLWKKTADNNLQIYYKSLKNTDLKKVSIYTSEHASVAHNFYSLNNGVLLLEMYYNEELELNFCVTRIGSPIKRDSVSVLYQGCCERMPYINIVKLSVTPETEMVEERILLNYDNAGISQLLLLGGKNGDEDLIINSSLYGRYENGTIENGRKIIFAGGQGNYIYYQMLYNSVGDPPPKVATFEATGTAVLFRYNIHSDEIERVTNLDNIVLHINANSKYALLSEYDYDKPLEDSGKLLKLGRQEESCVIPGVESGFDICESRFVNESFLAFYTSQKLYFIDLKTKRISTYDLQQNTFVYFGEDSVYLALGNEQIKILCFSYKEVFE